MPDLSKAVATDGPADMQYAYIPITKRDASTRMVEGIISGPGVDLDGQIVDQEWLREALPKWMIFGNVRAQHDAKRPVGKAVELDLTHPGGPWIRAKIVDDEAWKLCQEGVYSGFSIGIKGPQIVRDGVAPNGRIRGRAVCEVSVVDHPSYHSAKLALVKSADAAGAWVDLQTNAVIDADHLPPPAILPVAPFMDPTVITERNAAPDMLKGAELGSLPKGARLDPAGLATPDAEDQRMALLVQALRGVQSGTPSPALKGTMNEETAMGDLDEKENGAEKSPAPDAEKAQKHDEQPNTDAAPPASTPDSLDHSTQAKADDDEGEEDKSEKAAGDFGAIEQAGPMNPSGAGNAMWVMMEDIKSRMDAMMSALGSYSQAPFHPNGGRQRGKPGASPAEMGTTPREEQVWQGRRSSDPSIGRIKDADADLTKTVAALSEEVRALRGSLSSLVQAEISKIASLPRDDDGVLHKGALVPDSAKAALYTMVSETAQDAVQAALAEAVPPLSERLAKVEKAAMPPRGVQNAAVVEKTFALDGQPRTTEPTTVEKMAAQQSLSGLLERLPDDQKTKLVAEYLRTQYSGRS